jgi:GAF domain-containing protein
VEGDARKFFRLTHLYRPLGGPPVPERMDARGVFPWCQEQTMANRVVAVSSLNSLPPEAERDLQVWRHYGIKTSLTIPLSAGGEAPFGTLSFNTMREERDWPKATVKRLQLVAQVFANALARKRSDEMLRESEERLSMASDSAGAVLWSLDLASGSFWVTEKAGEMFGLPPKETLTLERLLISLRVPG